jgi:hypothetical protein
MQTDYIYILNDVSNIFSFLLPYSTMWGPRSIAKLVHISPISLWFMAFIRRRIPSKTTIWDLCYLMWKGSCIYAPLSNAKKGLHIRTLSKAFTHAYVTKSNWCFYQWSYSTVLRGIQFANNWHELNMSFSSRGSG